MKDKMIQVDSKTHTIAKETANKIGMTLRGYIKMLVLQNMKKIEKDVEK